MKSAKKPDKKPIFKQQVYFKRKSDEDLVRRAAFIKDISISMFIRDVVVKEAHKVIAEHLSGVNVA